jgi:recombination protein RecR
MKYPPHLLKLIEVLKKLPGVGQKSAERFAFQMLSWSPKQLEDFASVIREIPQRLHACLTCGCLMEGSNCSFCLPQRQATKSICVIAFPRDAYAIESTHEYLGLYHVLGGVLSPMEGFNSEQLAIGKLKERIKECDLKEVVMALDSTLEGDATALFLKRELEQLPVSMTRLAFGIPIGSSLDYIDGSTLARAFLGRSRF